MNETIVIFDGAERGVALGCVAGAASEASG
jgi:hypothetical protein